MSIRANMGRAREAATFWEEMYGPPLTDEQREQLQVVIATYITSARNDAYKVAEQVVTARIGAALQGTASALQAQHE